MSRLTIFATEQSKPNGWRNTFEMGGMWYLQRRGDLERRDLYSIFSINLKLSERITPSTVMYSRRNRCKCLSFGWGRRYWNRSKKNVFSENSRKQ